MAQQSVFTSKLFGLLMILEKVALAIFLAGGALKYLHQTGANLLIMLALTALGGIYFLTAFRPPAVQEEGAASQEKKGIAELLQQTIAPKIGWLSSAVCCIGVLYFLLHMPGARDMGIIGGVAAAGSLLIIVYGMATGNEVAKGNTQLLYRLIPLLVLIIYLYYRIPEPPLMEPV